MFNISKYSVTHRSIVYLFIAILLIGGIYAFGALGKREDSAFVIKTAVVVCPYGGATPAQVEALVVEPLERELRTLTSLRKITSEAHYGYARISVELQPATSARDVPQLWDELRRKVDNVVPSLPEGAGPVTVVDSFGDVYGIYLALVGDDGYSWDELRQTAEHIQTRLYTIPGVEKVVLAAEQSPVINVTITTAKLAAFDIRPEDIAAAVRSQNSVVSLGEHREGELTVGVVEATLYSSIEDIENQLLIASDGKQYRLGDIATVERGYREPPTELMWVDGRRAIAIAAATDPERDIVAVGDMIDATIAELGASLPVGMDVVVLYPENEIAREATNDFLVNLVESLLIVIVLVMFVMGWRSGVVVGTSLVISIAATLLAMLYIGEGLNRTSLAGFIIAMGMLVDNAIVVTDNMRGLSSSGMSLGRAAVVGATAPRRALLVATLIAIISFLPLQLAPSSVAEIIRPLFVVVALSLVASWLLALTQVPVMALSLLRVKRVEHNAERSLWFRGVVEGLMRYRWMTLVGVVVLFVLSLVAMSRMPQNFFPQLSKPYFRADVILAEGYDIEATSEQLNTACRWLRSQPEVRRVSMTAGATPPRYYLASGSYAGRANYGNILVELHDASMTEGVEARFRAWVADSMPNIWLRSSLFKLSPVPDAAIELGFVGENIDTLARLTADAMSLMSASGDAVNIRNSWGNRIPIWEPRYSQIKGQRIGVSREAMLRTLQISTDGMEIGRYREEDRTLPILLRSQHLADTALNTLQTAPVFSAGGRAFALEQAVSEFDLKFELPVIKRVDMERVMMAQADPASGVNTIALFERLYNDVSRNIELPEGYRLEVFGEEQGREESNSAIADKLPLTMVLIFLLLVTLFGSLGDTIVVVVTIPLIFIGVVLGLAILDRMFDFFSLLGLLGLVGMSVKNSVILISRINELRGKGVAPFEAVSRAAADRFVPVIAASMTTVLGMVPLLFDSLFGSMAATIMGGLVVATLLVLVVLPVLYVIIYRIKQ